MAVPFTVDFEELDGYPKSGWQAGEFRATRKLQCAWHDREQLLVELNSYNGSLYPYPDGPYFNDGGTIVPLATAQAVQVEGFGGQTSDDNLESFTGHASAQYPHARLTVTYSNRGWTWVNLNTLRVTETIEPFTIHESVPRDELHWDNGSGALLDQSVGQLMYGLEYVYSIDGLATVPSSFLSLVGTTNVNPVTSWTLGTTFPAESLLYKPPTLSRSAGWALTEKRQITYRLSYHPFGWNKFWRADGGANGQYENVFRSDGAQYIQYPLATFF